MSFLRAHIALLLLLLLSAASFAQQAPQASASLRTDATNLLVGDQARVFLSAQIVPAQGTIIWPQLPDSFGKLEVVKKDKIVAFHLEAGNMRRSAEEVKEEPKPKGK